MAPDVGAVVGHEDREVADDRDPEFVGPAAEARPLLVKQELEQAGVVDRLRERAAGGGERRGIAAGRVGGPLGPGAAAEVRLERGEQRVVVEPRPLGIGELVERLAERGGRPAGEPRRHLVEQARSRPDHAPEIDVVGGQLRQRREAGVVHESGLAETIQRDQQRVAGERREGLVGRIAVAGRPEGQHLPEPL